MSSELAQAYVKLGFKIDTNETKKAEKEVSKINKSIGSIKKSAGLVTGAIGTLMAGFGVGLAVQSGANSANMRAALGLDKASIDQYEFAAKKLGGSIEGTFSNLRNQITASFEGGASDSFYRFIGNGVKTVEEANDKIFESLAGKEDLEKRNILQQLGISGTDQLPYLQGKEKFDAALAESPSNTKEEESEMKKLVDTLNLMVEELKTGVIKTLADNAPILQEGLKAVAEGIKTAFDWIEKGVFWDKLYDALRQAIWGKDDDENVDPPKPLTKEEEQGRQVAKFQKEEALKLKLKQSQTLQEQVETQKIETAKHKEVYETKNPESSYWDSMKFGGNVATGIVRERETAKVEGVIEVKVTTDKGTSATTKTQIMINKADVTSTRG